MTQKKENSTNSRNGELRALETFSGILIFSRLEIIRFDSLIRKGKVLLIERKCELLDYEDIDSGTQFQSILQAMKCLGTIQSVRIDDL